MLPWPVSVVSPPRCCGLPVPVRSERAAVLPACPGHRGCGPGPWRRVHPPPGAHRRVPWGRSAPHAHGHPSRRGRPGWSAPRVPAGLEVVRVPQRSPTAVWGVGRAYGRGVHVPPGSHRRAPWGGSVPTRPWPRRSSGPAGVGGGRGATLGPHRAGVESGAEHVIASGTRPRGPKRCGRGATAAPWAGQGSGGAEACVQCPRRRGGTGQPGAGGRGGARWGSLVWGVPGRGAGRSGA